VPDTDVLAEAFADFAERAGREVISPGSRAVRRTVRHRRARRSVVTAMALVLVLAGGLAVWPRVGSGRGGSTSSTVHRDSAATLEAYREQAVNALPHLSGPFIYATDSAAIVGPRYTNPARDFKDVAPGSVTIYIVCAGTGSLTIDVNVAGSAGTADVACTSGGGSKIEKFAVPTDDGGYLFVQITASPDCVGMCSFAYEIAQTTDGS